MISTRQTQTVVRADRRYDRQPYAAAGTDAFHRYDGEPLRREDGPCFGALFLLMDVRMAMTDGLQAAVNIRRRDRADAGTIPIAAMTANAFGKDVEKNRAANPNAHLSKPIDPELMDGTPAHLIDH